jgi:hypothetical protein
MPRRGLSRSWPVRLVAIVLLAAQAVSSLLAPSADARAEQSAPAHVESAGTRLHHSHNPADCMACAALRIVSTPARHNALAAFIGVRHEIVAQANRTPCLQRRSGGKSARSPPLLAA